MLDGALAYVTGLMTMAQEAGAVAEITVGGTDEGRRAELIVDGTLSVGGTSASPGRVASLTVLAVPATA